MFIYFWERERQSVSGGGTETEGDTESEAGSRLWVISTEPDMGLKLTNHELMTWAEVGCLTDWSTWIGDIILDIKVGPLQSNESLKVENFVSQVIGEMEEGEIWNLRGTCPALVGFEGRGRGAMSQELKHLLETGNGPWVIASKQENRTLVPQLQGREFCQRVRWIGSGFSPRAPGKECSLLNLGWGGLYWTCDPPNSQMINLCYLKPLTLLWQH